MTTHLPLRIAVTGATGFVGRQLLAKLLADGHQVSALVRNASRAGLDTRVRGVEGDLQSPVALAELMRGANVLIHVAGAIMAMNRDAFFAVNAMGSQHVAEAAKAASVNRVILISSLAARAPEVSDYAASKRAGEEAMQGVFTDNQLLILRPSAIYGPGDVATIPLFKALTQRIAILPGRAVNRFSLLHVRDFANIIAEAVGGKQFGVYEIDDGKTSGYNWQELMAISQSIHGYPRQLHMLPKFLPMSVAIISEMISKLRAKPTIVTRGKISEIYYADWVASGTWSRPNAIGALEGFSETFSWYMERGTLPKRAILKDANR